MAASTTSTARKDPFGPSLSIENPPLIGVKAAKNKTIRQILLRDPDAESPPVASPDPNTCAGPQPELSSISQCYQSALTASLAQCVEPAKDSFVTARISNSTTVAASSIKSPGDDPVESGAGRTSSEVSDESGLSSLAGGGMNKPHKGNDSRWGAIRTVRFREGALGLSHFRLLKRLGCGDIGSVYLAELSGTQSYFAMKVMDKAALAARKKLPRAQTEREILQCLDHPFLPTLYTHFETEKFSCLVMEFCPGGDLHSLRQRQPGKYFSEQAARFYASEVLLALEYLHMLGIIYRDLKPENVLVREDGHIMLSDFDLSLRSSVCPTLVKSSRYTTTGMSSGTSRYCVQPSCIEPNACIQPPPCMQPTCFSPRFLRKSGSKDSGGRSNLGNNRTRNNGEFASQACSTLPELLAEPTGARSMSFVGTHEYLAPEIVKGEGHGSAVDWWTFGIFLYELLFGRTPFKGAGNRATLFNVVGEALKFPEVPTVSFAARDLIRGLLVKEPQQRLAYRRGATEVKQHPFFNSVNWALIRCTSPPEVPKQFKKSNGLYPPDGGGRGGAAAVAAGDGGGDGHDADGRYVDIDFF